MKLVHEIEPGIFLPFPSGRPLRKLAATETVIVRREDGSETREDRPCEPYPVEVRPAEVALAWPKEEREAAGLFEVTPFVAPEGLRPVGAPRYARVKGRVVEDYDVEPLPPAPTPEEKLAALGLDDEMIDALAGKLAQRARA